MSKGKYYFSKSLDKGLKILALFNRDQGNAVAASEYARKLYELAPQDPRAQQLLRELETGSS